MNFCRLFLVAYNLFISKKYARRVPIRDLKIQSKVDDFNVKSTLLVLLKQGHQDNKAWALGHFAIDLDQKSGLADAGATRACKIIFYASDWD